MLETKAPQRARNYTLHAIGTYLFFEVYLLNRTEQNRNFIWT